MILQALLTQALEGHVEDVAVCFRDSGVERWAFTGIYKVKPAEVVNAAVRITWRLARKQELP
jgi:hypothetical protein